MNVSVEGHARKEETEGENRGRRARAARFRCLVQSSLTGGYIQRNNKKEREKEMTKM